MSSKKQRTKQRHKPHAKSSTPQANAPVVHRYTATVRSPLGEWWYEHRRVVKLGAGIGGGAVVVGWLLAELIHLLLFNSPF